MYWVNGVPKKTISLRNRGLHYGDGFFTTARVQNGKIIFLNWHMNRLVLSAKLLMFDNLNFDLLYQEMIDAARLRVDGVIKIIITRQCDNRGYNYNPKFEHELIRIINITRLPSHYVQWYRYGIRLKTCSIRLARGSFLSGVKHLNRLEQVMIANWIFENKEIDEALVLDIDDKVIECCSANIFWRYDHQVFTPSVHYAGVNGVVRQLIIKLLPMLGYGVKEVSVDVEHLKQADEVFITNSLLPIASVNTVDHCFYTDKTLFYVLCSYFMNNVTYVQPCDLLYNRQ